MVPLQKLEQIHQRYEFLEAQMSAGISGEEIAKLSKEYSQLKPVVETIEEYKSLLADLQEAEVMMADPDMRQLAEEEIPILKARVPEMEQGVRVRVVARARGRVVVLCAPRVSVNVNMQNRENRLFL